MLVQRKPARHVSRVGRANAASRGRSGSTQSSIEEFRPVLVIEELGGQLRGGKRQPIQYLLEDVVCGGMMVDDSQWL